jgi:hypothetical protein
MSDELVVTNPEPDADEERLNALEQIIEHSLTSALDAVEEIKRDRLYRGRYASIEDYVLERWIQSEQKFHRYNSFLEVRDLIEDVGKSTAGLSKRIARQLSISPTPEEHKEILNVAKEKARKNRMTKRIKGWRRIRKHENLRPGKWLTNSRVTYLAHFVHWDPNDGTKAIVDIWGSAEKLDSDHSTIEDQDPGPPEPVSSYGLLTLSIDYRDLRVVR